MSDDHGQEHDAGQRAALPQADGPLVKVELPDGQHLYAVVKARRREPDRSWWYDLRIHLPSQAPSGAGPWSCAPRSTSAPRPRSARPSTASPTTTSPTNGPGSPPAWKVEETVYFGPERGPARIMHRGDCRTARDLTRPATTDQARTVLTRDDTAPCPVRRPEQPPRAAA
ncbi:DUF6233 domain-containing protein [Streptomyces sp. NPDC049040]|uniref:DUF6233 domain-containing protein n=1 Tax=Streptomyces sp. NPDC049040 TaxID=3365593 RepID=UPI0037214928